jgi:hypothetical protein
MALSVLRDRFQDQGIGARGVGSRLRRRGGAGLVLSASTSR